MASFPSACPHCKASLSAAPSTSVCPDCGRDVLSSPFRPTKTGGKTATYPTAKPYAPPPVEEVASAGSGWLMVALAGGLCLVLVAAIGGVIYFAANSNTTQVVQNNPPDEPGLDTLPPGGENGGPKPKPDINPPPEIDKNKPKPTPLPKPEDEHPQAVDPKPKPMDPVVSPPKPGPENPPKIEQPGPGPRPGPRPIDEKPATGPLPPKNEPPKNEPPPAVTPPGPIGQEPVALLPVEPIDPKLLAAGPGMLPQSTSDLKYKIIPFEIGERSKKLRLAVTSQGWDNLGSLLNLLGPGYSFANIGYNVLLEPKNIAQYDVIFINCAPENLDDPRIYSTLRKYVENGGTLYASDLRYHLLAKIFPEYTVPRAGINDLHGYVDALVVDPGLKRVLGPTVKLHFDLHHCPAAFSAHKAKIYMITHQANPFGGSQPIAVPLLTRFACGKGTVIYTSFHNAKQINKLELKLLMSIVFSAINSEVETKSFVALTKAGYTFGESKNLGISKGYSLNRQPFEHKGGKLGIALGFRKEGAKLQMTLYTPDGKTIVNTASSSFVIDVADAPKGTWHYAVSALETPYDNFAYTIMTGKPK